MNGWKGILSPQLCLRPASAVQLTGTASSWRGNGCLLLIDGDDLAVRSGRMNRSRPYENVVLDALLDDLRMWIRW